MNADYQKIKNQIVDSLDLSKFLPSQQEKIISGLVNNVINRINIDILDTLSEEDLQKIKKISKKGVKNDILEFIKTRIQNLSEISQKAVDEIVKDFRNAREVNILTNLFI